MESQATNPYDLMRMLYKGGHEIVIIELPTGQCKRDTLVSHDDRLVISENIVIIAFPVPDLNQKSEISWQWSPDAEVYLETIDIFTRRNYKRYFDHMTSDGSRIWGEDERHQLMKKGRQPIILVSYFFLRKLHKN